MGLFIGFGLAIVYLLLKPGTLVTSRSAQPVAMVAQLSTEIPTPTMIVSTVTPGPWFAVVVEQSSRQAHIGYAVPSPGMAFAVVTVKITNNGKDRLPYTPFHFRIKNAEPFEYQPAFVAVLNELQDGVLKPGDFVRGAMAFERLASSAFRQTLGFEPVAPLEDIPAVELAFMWRS